MRKYLAAVALFVIPVMYGQGLKLSVFDRLKPKASEVTDLNLNKDMLGLGASFLGGDHKDPDGAKIKKLVDGLSSIMVKSLEFEKEGVITPADVQQLIAELAGPGWNQVVNAEDRKSGEVSRIWTKSGPNGEMGGLRVLSAEPKELSVIEIVGKVQMADLDELKHLGMLPAIMSEHGQAGKKDDQ